jgi:hypothetical protein
LRGPVSEAVGVALQDSELPRPHGVERVTGEESTHESVRLREVLEHVLTNDLEGPRLRGGRSVREKPGQSFRQAGEVVRRQLSSAEEHLGTSLIREPSHVDGIVDHIAVQAEPVATRTESDRNDPEVDVTGEPSVQPDLVLAAALASLERRVVHEAVVHGTLELSHVPVGEKHPRDVRRELSDPKGLRSWVRLRAPEILEERPDVLVPRHDLSVSGSL